jgi:hypothetical protein
MTVEEAVPQIRRVARRLGRTAKALEQIQSDLVSASLDSLREIAAGGRPITVEAYLVAVLQVTIVKLDILEWDLRHAVRKQTLQWVEKNRKAGTMATAAEREDISAALKARRV